MYAIRSYYANFYVDPGADLTTLASRVEKGFRQLQANRSGRPFDFKTK